MLFQEFVNRSYLDIGNAYVLDDIAVRIEKLGSHCAGMRQTCLFIQLRQPVALDDLHIIIQEQNIIAI